MRNGLRLHDQNLLARSSAGFVGTARTAWLLGKTLYLSLFPLKMLILIITKRVLFGTDFGEPFVTLSLRRHKTPSMGHRREPEECSEAVGAAEESGFLLPARHRALRRFKCKNTLFYYHGA